MKLRIWNLTKIFPGKVNFIDEDNVILGYELEQSCCENTFWTISTEPDGGNPLYRGDDSESQEIELEGYRFDPEFFQKEENEGEECYAAIFKLVGPRYLADALPDLYLRLENHHNGYYSHGFTFRGGRVIQGIL